MCVRILVNCKLTMQHKHLIKMRNYIATMVHIAINRAFFRETYEISRFFNRKLSSIREVSLYYALAL